MKSDWWILAFGFLASFAVWGGTLFLPWRHIYKGEGLFTTLPLWWEYGDLIDNAEVVTGHIILSFVVGLSFSLLASKVINRGACGS